MNAKRRDDDGPADRVTAKMAKPGLLAGVRNSFFTGVVIAAPIFITAGVLYWLITGPLANIDTLVRENIPPSLVPDWALDDSGTVVPVLGVVFAVVLITLLGMMAKNFIGRFFIGTGERILDAIPIVRNVYGFFKNVFEMALQQSEQSFQEVALVEYPRPGLWTLCFVVTKTRGEVQHALSDAGDDMTSVFVPTTPNPTSGFLLFTKRSDLRILTMTVEEGAKKIFSAGLVAPEFNPDNVATNIEATVTTDATDPPPTRSLNRR